MFGASLIFALLFYDHSDTHDASGEPRLLVADIVLTVLSSVALTRQCPVRGIDFRQSHRSAYRRLKTSTVGAFTTLLVPRRKYNRRGYRTVSQVLSPVMKTSSCLAYVDLARAHPTFKYNLWGASTHQ